MRASVIGIGVRGPGLDGWDASREVLAGRAVHQARETLIPPPAILSATERRRTGPVVRLALAVAQEAAARSGCAPDCLRSVFASSAGDGAVVSAILEALSDPDGQVSPTQFHNSVHNAAAGYWSIANASAAPASCLGCHDFTFAAALLKATAEVRVERAPVLLCVYDVPLPEPLATSRPIAGAFGLALVLSPEAGGPSLGRIAVRWSVDAPSGDAGDPRAPALRSIARASPAGRALRLLESLAKGQADAFALPYLDGRLDLDVQPCPNPPSPR